MLHALTAEGDDRPVWFVHGARDGGHHPLTREIRELATRRPKIRVQVAYSIPRNEDEAGADYDIEGRVDGALLASLAGTLDAHYLLCGPADFMADIHNDLANRGVPIERIHSETFGPVS
jgi:hypothetical protein